MKYLLLLMSLTSCYEGREYPTFVYQEKVIIVHGFYTSCKGYVCRDEGIYESRVCVEELTCKRTDGYKVHEGYVFMYKDDVRSMEKR